MALAYALPSTSTFKLPFAEAGFTMTYGPEVLSLIARGAHYVDRILRGARPADLPIEEPTQFELALNLKTVEALGLNIPLEVAAQVTEWID
jgi:putative tryptophan/tyrosine transport system substrate-binding protein